MSTSTPITHNDTDPFPDPRTGRLSESRLDPAEAFPDALHTLSLGELQVLHSRICRQLDREFLSIHEGPHPCTADRLHDLLKEFETREAR